MIPTTKTDATVAAIILRIEIATVRQIDALCAACSDEILGLITDTDADRVSPGFAAQATAKASTYIGRRSACRLWAAECQGQLDQLLDADAGRWLDDQDERDEDPFAGDPDADDPGIPGTGA
jgi:hypothetical protein